MLFEIHGRAAVKPTRRQVNIVRGASQPKPAPGWAWELQQRAVGIAAKIEERK